MWIIFSTKAGSMNSSPNTVEEKKTIFSTKQAPDPVGPYSKAIKCGNILFCSGQIGIDPKTTKLVEWGIENETKQACHNIEAVLSEFGLGLKDVVKTTVFVKNISDYEKVNEIYKNYFIVKPARSMLEVSALPGWAQIEIEVIAQYN